jgi:glycosyltransferase involved in cell wall biosynthesis
MRKIKIIHIIDSLSLGGREKVVIDICNNLDNTKFEVSIIVLSNNNNTLQKELNSEIKVYSLPFKRSTLGGFKAIAFWLLGLPKLILLFKANRPDIIHTHLFFQHLFFVSVCIKLSRLKILHFRSIHTSGKYYENNSILKRFRLMVEKFAASINNTYIISSTSEYSHIKNIINFKKNVLDLRCIANGIDLKKYNKTRYNYKSKIDYGFAETDVIITYVARIVKGKNHLTLVEAWKHLCNETPHAKLCFIGDGEQRKIIEDECIKANLSGKIIFLGIISNVCEFLAISDIAVFPSQFEGFPLVLIEKMAMELPVVASDIIVFKEIIKDNINGFIVPVNDSIKYAEIIASIITDQTLRKHIGQEARKTALHYSLESAVRKHEEYYTEKFNEK